MKKTCILLSLIMTLCIVVVDPVWATTISDIKKEQGETKDKLNQANSAISSLQGKKEDLEDQIDELDSSIIEMMASISIIEEEITAKEAQIVEAQKEYDAAKALEVEQNEAMKIRIRCMYEKGDTAYLQLFMEAKSFTDLINKADYIEKIYEYDRKLLVEYQETCQRVSDLKNQLEEEEADLLTSKEELEEEKQALDVELTEKKKASSNYAAQIAKAKQEAEAYKAKIKQQTAKIQKLEAEAAAKEAAKKKPQNSNVSQSAATIITNATGSALGKEIANYAVQFVGNPYVPGGTSLTNGADCSGFTYAVYKAYGYNLPRSSTSQRSAGKSVDYASAQPGDLVCYAGHVGLYIGGGKIVHASSVKTGIKISNATYKPILAVRRIV